MNDSARRQLTNSPHSEPSTLRPTAPTTTRVEALLELGLEAEELAAALAVTPTTIRNWARGTASPRRIAVRAVDDLRRAVVILADGGITGETAGQWLRSRQGGVLKDERPLDIVRKDPVRVIAAATEYAIEQQELAQEAGTLHVVPD
jgi:DNA-binding transcriptional regulator YiaG